MARLVDLPPRYWQMALAKTLVFSRWRGQPYVRSRGVMKPRQRSQAELDTVAEFSANSAAFKTRDTITDQALQGMVISTQKRTLDVWMSLAVGTGVIYSGWQYHPDLAGNTMIQIPLSYVPGTGSMTIPVNSAAGIVASGIIAYVPFSLATFNRFRIVGWGNSNQAGQTVTQRMCRNAAYNQPINATSGDKVWTNTFGFNDTGAISIDSPPSTDEIWYMGLRGSNGTVDFTSFGQLLIIWQEN